MRFLLELLLCHAYMLIQSADGGDTAAVELESLSKALDGKPFLYPPTFYVSEKIPYYLKFATRK